MTIRGAWIGYCKILGSLALSCGLASPALAQAFRSVRLTAGLQAPVYACAAPGDASRIFVVQQAGLIRVLKDGNLLPAPFMNLAAKIQVGAERGLLGLAFHPSYASNGLFFVSYTRAADGASIVERYSVSSNPDIGDPATSRVIVGPLADPGATHNGGCIQFGGDGMLYLGLGDGGNSFGANSQLGSTLFGKLLRFDVDIPAPHIPPTNPFVGDPSVRDEIWDFGLRNPWRFSFDRVRGDLFIGDVGESSTEEVSFEPAGGGARNYGWPCMEGQNCWSNVGCTCNAPSLTLPIETYHHSFGCVVIGGYIYRGCAMPALQGTYFYGDYCTARIWSFTYDASTGTKGPTIDRTAQLFPGGNQTINSITSFGEDALGELLIVDQGGELYKIVPASAQDCNANGVEDACDLAVGNSLDVNGNAIPDECEGAAPAVYCAGKSTSSGCAPSMTSNGYSSATLGTGFLVMAVDCMNSKPGFLLYGLSGRAATPFQGGTLCVASPIRRAPGTTSGGSIPPANDCTGVFAIDFNAFAVGSLGGNPHPALRIPGSVVDCQWWGRDPGYPPGSNSQLANGLEFQVCP